MISHAYPLTEFGILIRPDKERMPRYASTRWIKQLGETASSMQEAGNPMKLAAHLCGSRVNEVLEGHGAEFLRYLIDSGFQRVQINATAVNGVNTSRLAESVLVLWNTIHEFPQLEFILQKNEETKPLWEGIEELLRKGSVSNVAVLLDESKGTGILSLSWPKPSAFCKTGYAGGIGPQNVATVLPEIANVAQGKTFWIDMESSLRSTKNGNDVFDLDKCYQVIDAVCTLKLMERPCYLK